MIRAVAMLGATIAVLGVIGASVRVIGWMLAAAVLAGVFFPLVQVLDRRVPRPLAMAIVILGTVGIVVTISYGVVHDVTSQLHELQRAVPRAARDLERSDRYGKTARELRLAQHAKEFIDELPKRLRGGDARTALRSAATRGVAFLATTVLMIFFLIYGPRLLSSAAAQLPERRREVITRVAESAYRRTWSYVVGSLAMSTMAGLVAYGCAELLHLPGKAPLALGVALFDLIPLIGLLLGALPLFLLAGTTATWQATVLLATVIAGWQVVEALYFQRRVEEHSLHLGPFITVAVAMIGLELYGIGGVFVALVFAVAAAAVLDESLGHGPHSSAPT